MKYTIYKITNKIDGKIYIGKHQTNNLDDCYMGSGKILRRAQKKHGLENFVKEILHVFDTEDEMNAKEKELVTEEFCLHEDTYNLCVGGHGGFSHINRAGLNVYGKNGQSGYGLENLKDWTGIPLADETKKKISDALIGKQTWWIGKTHSEETKHKIGLANSESQLGSRNSQFGSFWITNGSENKKVKGVCNIPEGWYKGRVTK
jgi:group I intron endonuclease